MWYDKTHITRVEEDSISMCYYKVLEEIKTHDTNAAMVSAIPGPGCAVIAVHGVMATREIMEAVRVVMDRWDKGVDK